MGMKQFVSGLILTALMCLPAVGAPLSSNARTVIPSAIQQVISVDYRALRGSQTALALKNRVLPDNLKQFETALRAFGIDPSKDVEQLTFVSYRQGKGGLYAIGIAQGPFKQREFLQKMRLKKIVLIVDRHALECQLFNGSGVELAIQYAGLQQGCQARCRHVVGRLDV